MATTVPRRESSTAGHASGSCVSCPRFRSPPDTGQEFLLGNGFHIPSLLAIFMMLPAILDAKLVLAPSAPDLPLRSWLKGGIWEPQRLDSFPGLLTSTQIIRDMQCCFEDILIPEPIWSDVERRLSHCKLARLQGFAAWRRLRGEPWQSLGPSPLLARDRTGIYAGLSGQRYASSSARGLDHLLPPGLGPTSWLHCSSPLPFDPVRGPSRMFPSSLKLWWLGVSTYRALPMLSDLFCAAWLQL